MTVYYDYQFNQNEWFILLLLITTYTLVFLLPKRFSMPVSMVFILYGIALGHFVDHTVSVQPFDYYDVNDSSSYQLFDFLSYVMYGPFSYFIVYFFDRFKLKKQHILFYIILWSLLAIGLEYIGIKLGVYHYEKSWKIQISFPSYLAINSILLTLYYKLCRQTSL